MRSRLCPLLLLAALGLLFFADLVAHPRQVLYSDYSDILAEHLPAKHFLVQSWQQTGELPLWCPYSYGGMPFIHDPQVAAFYPPHAVLYALPVDRIGAGMSWLIVAHLIMAGCFMYLYAGSNGIGTAGALVAGFGYMFAGKWLLHLLVAGHYITIGLAWLPLVLLGLEQAIRRKSILSATWAGAAFAFLVLGTHPQWTLYAGFFIALWTLASSLEQAGVLSGDTAAAGQDEKGTADLAGAPRRRIVLSLLRWVGFGAWVALVAAALSAVQLLPTLELARYSSRAGGLGVGDILADARYSVLNLFGPPLAFDPSQANFLWEERGALDILWVAVAAMAPVLCGRRVRFQAGVGLFVILFALGGSAALQWVPGFSLFRQPSRMFIVAGFPVAFLAGAATDALFPAQAATLQPSPQARRGCRLVFMMTLVIALILLAACGWQSFENDLQRRRLVFLFNPYWVVICLAVLVTLWVLGAPKLRWGQPFWVAVLFVSLWGFNWPVMPGATATTGVGRGWVTVALEKRVYSPSACVRYVQDGADGRGRVLDQYVPNSVGTPLGAGAPLAMLLQIEALRGYTPLDYLPYKEYLHFIGGEQEPLRSLGGPLTFPVIGDNSRRHMGIEIKNKSLANLLGVRYLLQPAGMPLPDEGWVRLEEDPRPAAYDFIAGGVQDLPPYVVYENKDALPRAFVVPRSKPLPDRARVFSVLTRTDFRRTVLIEPFGATEAKKSGPAPPVGFREAAIRAYLPNRVVVEVSGATSGYLVLADQWFPGWRCTLDGEAVQLLRADFLFRGVAVPAGNHELVFAFSPASYHLGKGISIAAGLAVAGISVVAGVVKFWRRNVHRVG